MSETTINDTAKAPCPNHNTAALVLGILSLYFCWLPLVGLPLATIGLVFSKQSRYSRGKKLNTIGLSVGIFLAILLVGCAT